MKTINYVIVEVDNTYNNTQKLSSGISIITNTSIENVSNINRKARVVKAPEFTILKEDDEVIIHHNIFRYRNGYHGKLVRSDYWIEDNKFFVPLTEVFAYKRDSEWKSLEPFCFIKPIKDNSKKEVNKFSLSDSAFNKKVHKGNKKLLGEVVYGNSQLENIGVTKGDKVMFSPWSEYEVKVDDQTLYRMKTNDITIKI